MKILHDCLNELLESSKGSREIIDSICNTQAVYPFSQEAQLLTYLLSLNEISFEDYESIRNAFIARNKYLYLFELAPRTYGQSWGEEHLLTLFPQLIKATKTNLINAYPLFNGEFDLWLNGIRIEVKACRASSTDSVGPLSERALLHEEANKCGFKYHFQQLKPSCCDVFICIGTCRDQLLYWVISSHELQESGKLKSQHRNQTSSPTGSSVFEGQVFMTEQELAPYLVEEGNILKAICHKAYEQSSSASSTH